MINDKTIPTRIVYNFIILVRGLEYSQDPIIYPVK